MAERAPWRVLMTLVPITPLRPVTPISPTHPSISPTHPSFHLPPPHFSTPHASPVPLSFSLVRCMAVPACLAAILVDTDGGYTYTDQVRMDAYTNEVRLDYYVDDHQLLLTMRPNQTWWPYQLVQWMLFLQSLVLLVFCVVGRLMQARRTVRMWLLYHGALLVVTSVVFIPEMADQEEEERHKRQWRVPGLPFSIGSLLAGRNNSRQAALLLLLASICLMSLLCYCIHTAITEQMEAAVSAIRRLSSSSKEEDRSLPSYEAAMRSSLGLRRVEAALGGDAASHCETMLRCDEQPPKYEEALRAGAVSPFGRRSCLFQQFSANLLGGDQPLEHVVVVEDIGGPGPEDRMVVHIVEDLNGTEEQMVVLEDITGTGNRSEEHEVVVEGREGMEQVKVVVAIDDINKQDSSNHEIVVKNINRNNVAKYLNTPENDKGAISDRSKTETKGNVSVENVVVKEKMKYIGHIEHAKEKINGDDHDANHVTSSVVVDETNVNDSIESAAVNATDKTVESVDPLFIEADIND